LDAPRRTGSDENQSGFGGLWGRQFWRQPPFKAAFHRIIEEPAESQAAAKIVGSTRVATDVFESLDARHALS
jgi:hypothetical protein